MRIKNILYMTGKVKNTKYQDSPQEKVLIHGKGRTAEVTFPHVNKPGVCGPLMYITT